MFDPFQILRSFESHMVFYGLSHTMIELLALQYTDGNEEGCDLALTCLFQFSESIDKQTKDRNETGSNLSLGTRLTVLSKRLGRNRCCDATPDRCL